MKLALTVSIVLALSLISAATVEVTASEFVPAMHSQLPTSRLLKRSFCNTFGGCGGSKRSLETSRHSSYRMGDDPNEVRRNDADAKMASEILEDIMDHLKRNENNRQGRYFMLGPKLTRKSDLASQASRGDDIGGIQIESD